MKAWECVETKKRLGEIINKTNFYLPTARSIPKTAAIGQLKSRLGEMYSI